MKKLKATLGAATLASVFAFTAPIASAQDVTSPMTTEIDQNDDSGKWGLLGLLGLIGLAGLKRKDHDTHTHTTANR